MNDILLSAFLLSLVLLGIHSYFGLEIIRRGIIFADLAVGQMAAFGAALALLALHGEFAYPVALVFALLAGLMIAVISARRSGVEALIGLMYALGISGVYILLSKSPHGMETFQKLMAADILFTPLGDIVKTAALYGGLGVVILVFHWRARGIIRDLLFFLTFAVTVTSSVRLAGVLIVFSLLVAPALVALTIGRGVLLVNAWIVGTVVNVVAIYASYKFDLPTGYTIVFFQAFTALAVCALPLQGGKRNHAVTSSHQGA